MEIIDAHCHIYPAKIAEKASRAIGEFYGVPMDYNGTSSPLLEEGKAAGVTRFLVHSVATTVKQVGSINVFLKEEAESHREFLPFMTLHPDLSEREIDEEIRTYLAAGFYGIKLHPDFQKFHVDGRRGRKICAAAEGRLPILYHVGDDRFDFSSPGRMAAIARDFPNLTIIAAHFGGYRQWQDADVYRGLSNVYFDTSSSLAYLTKEDALEKIRIYGADRFLFGTDYPMWSAAEEIVRVKKLGLDKKEEELIFYKNAERLLGL